jgi:hypothetical protein
VLESDAKVITQMSVNKMENEYKII